MADSQSYPVPYKSQWDPDANDSRDDCGPTSASMVLEFLDGKKRTSNEVFVKTGAAKDQAITIPQLQNAIAQYGFTSQFYVGQTIEQLKAWIDKGIIPIALVHYGDLSSRQDKGFSGGHFFPVVGYRNDAIIANDPDFYAPLRGDGDHHGYLLTDFINAWKNATKDANPANSYLVIFPKNTKKMVEVPADDYPKLIDKCNNRDSLYDLLGVPKDPIESNIDKPRAVIEGYKNLATGLQRQLSEATTQVANYKEKADRIQQTADTTAKTDKARIDALENSQKAFDLERESLKGQIDQFAKDKGTLTIENGALKIKLAQEQTKSGSTLEIPELVNLLVAKILRRKV